MGDDVDGKHHAQNMVCCVCDDKWVPMDAAIQSPMYAGADGCFQHPRFACMHAGLHVACGATPELP
eukprot:CAMPEP_0202904862 /NCGR_PEP_ID=MMETSP1392-20130828/31497_1 /ASSEMBLY_ACC=CAM_ASM_000868 /TAXON_ID=225041 /ORGANISM="Chlamydomonas chlamydogama, Strain SAG 11-48b" /LENGTH=65 /DNA_ID=CAMNT_0049592707 /DNA_START=1201 /DNA_END=1395 /DNA_ORIENTATION=+